jgi:hypothetical protein
MKITEAFVKSAFITNADLRIKIIALLVAGSLGICNNCGFTQTPGTMCEVCLNSWADMMAAKEDEMNWGRHDMMAGRY